MDCTIRPSLLVADFSFFHRIVSGNADSCFYLDESTGILSAKCDLGRLPMVRRTLNLTATDGQHFADVMPLEINLIGEVLFFYLFNGLLREIDIRDVPDVRLSLIIKNALDTCNLNKHLFLLSN